MDFKHFIVGLLSWALFSSLFVFMVLLFAGNHVTKDAYGIVTWRLFAVLFLSNCLLNAILIRMNK
jgi:hypothetical protein